MKRESGFTLVEVMVALFVLGIALPALLSQVLTQAEATAALRDRVLATWVARDELERLRLQQRVQASPPVTVTEGRRRLDQREWGWTLAVDETAVPGMVRQTLGVTNAEGATLITLTAYVSPRVPLQELAP